MYSNVAFSICLFLLLFFIIFLFWEFCVCIQISDAEHFTNSNAAVEL